MTVTARFRKRLAVAHGTPQRGGDPGAVDGMAFVLTLIVQTAGKTVRLGAELVSGQGNGLVFLLSAGKQLSLPRTWRACIKFGVRDPRDGWPPS